MPTPPPEVIYGGLAVAAYGAVLSTWSLGRSIAKSRSRLRLHMECIGCYLPDATGGPLKHFDLTQVTIFNPSDRHVTVVSAGLITTTMASYVPIPKQIGDTPPPKLPLELAPGREVTLDFEHPHPEVVAVWCRDRAGRKTTRRRYRFSTAFRRYRPPRYRTITRARDNLWRWATEKRTGRIHRRFLRSIGHTPIDRENSDQ